MRASEVFLFLQGGLHNRSITVYPSLVKLLGGLKETVFLLNLIQWLPETDPNKEVYKTAMEVENETSLSEKEQVTARKRLKVLGVLKERHARLEHRLYFSLDLDGLDRLLANLSPGVSRTSRAEVGEPTARRFVNKVQDSSSRELQEEGEKKDRLPDWLSVELWDRFKEHRRRMCQDRIGKKFTPYAEERALATLTRLRDQGNDPAQVIEQSINGPWQGLFQLKHNDRPSKIEAQRERTRQVFERPLPKRPGPK